MTTVTGMATPTPTIPVTVDTFQIARRFEGPKVTTVTGMATPTPTIPVTVDTFHIARGPKGPKVTTVTGMASTQPPPKKKTSDQRKKNKSKNKTPPILKYPWEMEMYKGIFCDGMEETLKVAPFQPASMPAPSLPPVKRSRVERDATANLFEGVINQLKNETFEEETARRIAKVTEKWLNHLGKL